MTRGIQEGDHATVGFHMVGADVLRNAAGFARSHLGAADVVQQRGLAVVDVTHHGHHRRTRQQLGVGVFLTAHHQQRFRIVQLGGMRLVAHFFHHDHGGFLVQHLVDRHHLAELHHLLDDLGRLDGHLVRQVGHGDGFRHVHFTHDRLGRCLEAAAAVVMLLLPAAAATRTTAPAAHAARRIAARLQAAALLAAAVVLPACLHDLALLVGGRRGRGRGGRLLFVLLRFRGRTGRLDRLVQRTGLLGLLFLGLALGRRLQHAGRCVQHLLDRTGLGFGSLAALARSDFLLGASLVGGSLGLVGSLLRLGAFGGDACLLVLCLLARGVLVGLGHGARCGSLFLRLAGGEFGLAALFSLQGFLAGAALGFLTLGCLAGGLGFSFLARQLLGLVAFFLVAACLLGSVDDRRLGFSAVGLGIGRSFVALDQHALLAHFHLDRAGLAGAIRLADLGGFALGQCDLLAGAVVGLAVRTLQIVQQPGLIRFRDDVFWRRFAHPSRLQLFQQGSCAATQFCGQLGNCCACHSNPFNAWFLRRDKSLRKARPGQV